MIGIIAIILIAWTMCAILTYAIIGYIDPDEVEGDEASTMALCFAIWPILAFVFVGYAIMKWLSHFGDWARGFLVGLFGKRGE